MGDWITVDITAGERCCDVPEGESHKFIHLITFPAFYFVGNIPHTQKVQQDPLYRHFKSECYILIKLKKKSQQKCLYSCMF